MAFGPRWGVPCSHPGYVQCITREWDLFKGYVLQATEEHLHDCGVDRILLVSVNHVDPEGRVSDAERFTTLIDHFGCLRINALGICGFA
jgi:hypothetical protein